MRRLRELSLVAAVVALVSVLVAGSGLDLSTSLFIPAAFAVTVFAWLTLAVVAMFGTAGYGPATVVLLGLAVVPVLGAQPSSWSSPWSDVWSFLPHDAALRLVEETLSGPGPGFEHLALLAPWGAVAASVTMLSLHLAENARARERKERIRRGGV